MIGLFKRNTAPVQTAMLVQMIQMMQEYQREVLTPEMPMAPEQSEQVAMLQELGFVNTKAMQEHKRQVDQFKAQTEAWQSVVDYKQYIKETMEVLFDARRCFGKDTLLIRFDDFEKLMKEFNLVCGSFDMYKGEVPMDKMADIAMLKGKMKYPPKYITVLKRIDKVNIIFDWKYDGLPKYIVRFPFMVDSGKYNFPWFKDSHGNDIRNWNKSYELESSREDTRLFICAPSKDMEKLESIVSFRRASDPFICAHTKYGILVFTRWGEEANSTIIKKYEQLNEMIEQRRADI